MFSAGDIIEEYQLVSPLGEGPKAQVWAAKRVDRLEMVTAKLLRPSVVHRTQLFKAFDRLVQTLTSYGRLEHPNLPRVLGTVRRPHDGLFGLVTEHLPGQTLDKYDARPSPEGSLLDDPAAFASLLLQIEQLCEVLGWLHVNGVVHGNVKASNVLITPGASGPTVKLLDLCWSRAGLAGFSDEQREYISPEVQSRKQLTEQSDQWCVAKILHQIIVRASPNKSQTQALTAAPIQLLRALQRALDKNPKARFEAMADFSQSIREVRIREEQKANASGATSRRNSRAQQIGYNPTTPLQQMSDPTEPQPAIQARSQTPIQASIQASIRQPIARAPSSSRPVPQAPSLEIVEAPPTERGQAVQPKAAEAHTAPVPANTPTAPVPDLGSLNISSERDFSGRLEPVRPADPTDVIPSLKKEPSGLSIKVLAIIATVLGLLVAFGAYTLFQGSKTQVAGTIANAAPPKAEDPPPTNTQDPPPANTQVPPPTPPPQVPPPTNTKVPPPTNTQVPPPTPPPKVPPPVSPPADAPCESNRACMSAGQRHLDNGDKVEAAKAFERACKYRGLKGCIQAGELMSNGSSRAQRRARRLFERACDLRNANACAKLADLYARGIGGSQSDRTAAAFRRRACQLGRSQSCE